MPNLSFELLPSRNFYLVRTFSIKKFLLHKVFFSLLLLIVNFMV